MKPDQALIEAVKSRSLVSWRDSFACEGFAHLYGPGPEGEPLLLVWQTLRGRWDSPKPDWVLVRVAKTPPAAVPGGPQDESRVLPIEHLRIFRGTWQ